MIVVMVAALEAGFFTGLTRRYLIHPLSMEERYVDSILFFALAHVVILVWVITLILSVRRFREVLIRYARRFLKLPSAITFDASESSDQR